MQFRMPKNSGNAHQRRIAVRKWKQSIDAALQTAARKILGIA